MRTNNKTVQKPCDKQNSKFSKPSPHEDILYSVKSATKKYINTASSVKNGKI